MELMELKEKTSLSREEAAARLHAIADCILDAGNKAARRTNTIRGPAA